jgi:hypothetical protein
MESAEPCGQRLTQIIHMLDMGRRYSISGNAASKTVPEAKLSGGARYDGRGS